VLDQVMKQVMVYVNSLYGSVTVIPGFFRLALSRNTGAGFGLLTSQNTLLIFITLIILGIILYQYPTFIKDTYLATSLAVVLGGAVGNLIDRLLSGAVIDFLAFTFGTFRWPSFNIADTAITLGIVALLLRKK